MSDETNNPYSAPQSENPAGAGGGVSATGHSRGTRREIVAWATYDWANSAFSTLLITTIVFYLTQLFPAADAQDPALPFVTLGGHTVEGAVVYAWGIGLSMLVAAILSPIVGALADARANKRIWFRTTALSGAICGALIGILPSSSPWLIAAAFVLTTFFYELSFGFYNSFLPEIADDSNMNRVSAAGFATGYVGGGIALILALVLVTFWKKLGLAGELDALRLGLVMMGVWWGVFSLPAVFTLRDKSVPRSRELPFSSAVKRALGEVRQTITNIRQFQMLGWFLIGFLFYNDAVQTVLTQASTFAFKEIWVDAATVDGREVPRHLMTIKDLIPIIIMIQFVSMPGALVVGKLADLYGQKKALYGCLAVWVVTLIASWWVNTSTEFWIMGAVVALVMGGTQSVSRSIMGVMTPANRTAEFFGFFNLSSKATSFIGPVTFGTILAVTGSARWAILSLVVQLVIGWLLVSRVNVEIGREQARVVA